jgi:hypothetical protein
MGISWDLVGISPGGSFFFVMNSDDSTAWW